MLFSHLLPHELRERIRTFWPLDRLGHRERSRRVRVEREAEDSLGRGYGEVDDAEYTAGFEYVIGLVHVGVP